MNAHTAENDAPVYACCQHCSDYDEGNEWCDLAPHDDACIKPYCSGARPYTCPIPPGTGQGAQD